MHSRLRDYSLRHLILGSSAYLFWRGSRELGWAPPRRVSGNGVYRGDVFGVQTFCCWGFDSSVGDSVPKTQAAKE